VGPKKSDQKTVPRKKKKTELGKKNLAGKKRSIRKIYILTKKTDPWGTVSSYP
jgi:hypothetical protein